MPRSRRFSPGGMVFHVLNRGVGRRVLFTKDEEFLAFERVVEESLRTRRMRLYAYCLLPNHWHFVVYCLYLVASTFVCPITCSAVACRSIVYSFSKARRLSAATVSARKSP
jgi:hypothetical protein